MLKSLECGAAFFILKPVKPVDCKNIWQYAVARSNKGKSIMVPKSIGSSLMAMPVEDPSRVRALVSASRGENGLKTKAHSKTKAKGQASMKKPKVAWTNFLHNRFLQAVNFIGIESEIPLCAPSKLLLPVDSSDSDMHVYIYTDRFASSYMFSQRLFRKRFSS